MDSLIVDDDDDMRALLELVLKERTHNVTACANAFAAWDAYRIHDYELVVLDWLMPEMDGLELCRKMRALPHGDRSIILVLTGQNKLEDLQAVLEAGADDYITKPVALDYLGVRLTIAERQVELLRERKRTEAELAASREQEIDVGSKIQRALLLGEPPRDRQYTTIAASTIPSQRVDGDFFEFLTLRDECLDLIIGDVMGKGIPAALMGAATKSQFLRATSHLLARCPSGQLPEPAEIVTLVHADVAKQFIDLESFVTLCYARFDFELCQVDLIDCGHPSTILFQPHIGTCKLLQGTNMPLGFSEKDTFEPVTASFEPGDVFLFYSDGVTEAQNATGELFGEARLMECLQHHHQLAPDAMLKRIRQEVEAFSNSQHFADDLTCIVVKIETPIPGARHTQLKLEIMSHLKELARVRDFVRHICTDLAPSVMKDEHIWQFELAATEAISNIINHAYTGHTDKNIEIKADLFPDRVVLELSHWGAPFDPSEAAPPIFDGTSEGGFGVYIIAQSVDDVRYTCDAQGKNHIQLIKYLTPST